MRVLLVVNPAASSVTPRARAGVERILRDAVPTDVVETTRRGHAAEIARDAVADDYDVVAVLAGDGTLNEAGDGLAGSTVALAPLPGGSTNVFARTLGIAYDPEDATRHLVESLHRERTRRIGLGVATTTTTSSGETSTGESVARHFLFHLGVGFDAAIIRRMEARSYLKRHFAHPAFAVATVDTWLRHFDRHQVIRLAIDVGGDVGGRGSGAELIAAGPYAVISNSDPYTYVGRRPMTIAPNAALDDALAVTVLTDLRARLLVRTAASSVGTAAYLESSPRIVQVAGVVGVELSSDSPFPWQVDGDYLGDVDHLTVAYRPDCLTIVTP